MLNNLPKTHYPSTLNIQAFIHMSCYLSKWIRSLVTIEQWKNTFLQSACCFHNLSLLIHSLVSLLQWTGVLEINYENYLEKINYILYNIYNSKNLIPKSETTNIFHTPHLNLMNDNKVTTVHTHFTIYFRLIF